MTDGEKEKRNWNVAKQKAFHANTKPESNEIRAKREDRKYSSFLLLFHNFFPLWRTKLRIIDKPSGIFIYFRVFRAVWWHFGASQMSSFISKLNFVCFDGFLCHSLSDVRVARCFSENTWAEFRPKLTPKKMRNARRMNCFSISFETNESFACTWNTVHCMHRIAQDKGRASQCINRSAEMAAREKNIRIAAAKKMQIHNIE